MKQSFNLDDFEAFLSDSAEQHRMYPNDRVWRNINAQLHKDNKWPALTFAAILTSTIIISILVFIHPDRALFDIPSTTKIASNILSKSPNKTSTITAIKSSSSTLALLEAPSNRNKTHTWEANHFSNQYEFNLEESNKSILDDQLFVTNDASLSTNSISENDSTFLRVAASTLSKENKQPIIISANEPENLQLLAQHVNKYQPIDVLHALPTSFDSSTQQSSAFPKATMMEEIVNRKQILGALKNKKQRWMIAFYATPSFSYRYLQDNKKESDKLNGPVANYLTNDVNKFVTHKPKMGLEAGVAVLYKVTNDLSIKAGLQLNYRQYAIDAYSTTNERAAIALNGRTLGDSLVRMSRISNNSGYRPIQLTNEYLQIAIPVGFDLKVMNLGKVDFHLASTAQLTYQLASRNFLLSSDYKNYLQQENLNRRWNINTAVEAFFSYQLNGITLQAGPQFRYQLLPGTKNLYPIEEHLIDYGMKIGVVKTIH